MTQARLCIMMQKDTIMPTDPIYNVRQDKLDAAKAYFAKIGGTPSHNVLTSEELE